MNNIGRRNFAVLELSRCIKPSVGLLHYVVAVHSPSEVLRKMDTEELKLMYRPVQYRTHQPRLNLARNATIVVKKVISHGLAFTGI